MTEPGQEPAQIRSGLSREDFLKSVAATGFALAGGASFLAACAGGGSTVPSSTTAAVGAPKHGGILKVGLIGGGNAESLNPANADLNGPNINGAYALYDTIVRLAPNSTPAPGLATEWSADPASKVWTFKIRPGVKFHNGKPLTGADLVYSFKYMAHPSNNAASLVSGVDIASVHAPDNNTLVVPLTGSQTQFPAVLTDPACAIIPAGTTDFTHPIGTGAFMFKSFTVGQQRVLVRNPRYWDGDKPYVEELQFLSISDDTARLNALLSGQINVMVQVPYTQGKTLASNSAIKLLSAPSNTPYLFYMRVDQAPFNDGRVRQAMRYIINRPAMIADAINGFGTVANDLIGKGLTFYDDSLPQRSQDLEKAKSLLKSAGQSDMNVTMYTSAIAPGVSEAATLFAQQASGAGVKVNLQTVPADAYFNSSLKYLKYPFASSFWTLSSIPQWYGEALGKNAPYNETHYNDPAFSKLLEEANAAKSPDQARQLWSQVQEIQWNQGGYAVWANVDNLDATAANVQGIRAARAYSMGSPTGAADAWLSN
jgi:peptide/nickel transport system substrate-binding protein